MSDVKQKVMEMLAKQAETDVAELNENKPLDELNIDSLSFSLLFFDLEDEFKVDISDIDPVNFKTVGDILRAVEQFTSEKAGSAGE